MEKIYQHIETLLINHDYVILPGIGGFVIQQHSASIINGVITAPRATISFNPLLQHADGLLAIEIARSEGLTYRKAVELLLKKNNLIKESLKSSGYFNFGNLGSIEKDENNDLIYSPPTNTDFIPSNLGLRKIQLNTNKTINKSTSRKVSFTLPSPRTLQYAAAATLLFSMLLFSPKINNQKHTMSAELFSIAFTEDMPSTSIERMESVETEKTNEFTELTELGTPKENIEQIATVENSIDILETEKKPFHVIVASLGSKAIAEKYCQSMIDQNFNNAHVLEPVRTHRVAIESFSDRNEAIEYMRNLRKSDKQFEQAWVLCN